MTSKIRWLLPLPISGAVTIFEAVYHWRIIGSDLDQDWFMMMTQSNGVFFCSDGAKMIKGRRRLHFSFSRYDWRDIDFTNPPPALATSCFIFGWSIVVFLTKRVHPHLIIHCGLGQMLEHDRLIIFVSPFPFCNLHQHILFHDWSKSKAPKKKAKQASITDWIAIFVFWSILSFSLFFFCQHIFPFPLRKHAKIDGVYVMDGQKLPWCGRPALFSTLFFSFLITEVHSLLCDTLFIPPISLFWVTL